MEGCKLRDLTLGERLKYFRLKAGLSRDKVAEKLLVTSVSLSLWERDKSSIRFRNAIELAQLYNVSLDELAFGTEEEIEWI